MTPEHAKMQGLTYAWGREDASRAVTPVSAYTFAEAFAQGWADFNDGKRNSMIPLRDAYDTWQATQGTAIFKPGDSSADHAARNAEWRRIRTIGEQS